MGKLKMKYLEGLKKKVAPILLRNGVVKAAVFGSFARGKATRKSDIDLLIRFRGDKSLLDLVGQQLELEDTLNKRVDVLTYSSIHPLLKERILREEVRIL